MAKVIVLLSGGIDSAAAISLALEQGMEVVALHCSTVALDKTAEQKTISLVRHLEQKFGKKIKLAVVPFFPILNAIVENCDRKFACVLCKRMMSRLGERLAAEENANALLKGDSLGQVASQTLSNLNAEAGCISIPVIRPLLGMDKLEIEAIAKKFETFKISTQPSSCCSIPDKPSTAAKRAFIELKEKKLDTKGLVETAFSERKLV